MDNLKAFNNFHDWYLDTLHVSKKHETLTLGLYLENRRVSVSFVGMNRCVLENLSLQNIVYGIEILEAGTQRHQRAERRLAKVEPWNDSKADKVAQLFSTCGLELVIEFDSLEIREDASMKEHGI